MKNTYLAYIIVSFIFISCGEKIDELKQTAENMQNIAKNYDNIEKSINRSEEILNKRRAIGDTLPLNFKELMVYLPDKINEFIGNEPEGSTTNSMGFAFSQVSRQYTNPNNPISYINISLVDYNAGYFALAGLAYWTNLDISTESSDGYEKTRKTNIEDVFAYEKFSKSGRNGSIFYVIGYRFYLTIEANNIDNPDILEKISSQIDLKKLSKI